MENHFDLTDTEFENEFKSCKLDPSIFSHEAHLRLAWINIKKYGIKQAEINIQTQLEKFVKFHGETDKYNKTLTIAAIRVVNHFANRSKSEKFEDLIVEFPRLKQKFKELIDAHYSIDIFNSELAKVEFIEPDLLPFESN